MRKLRLPAGSVHLNTAVLVPQVYCLEMITGEQGAGKRAVRWFSRGMKQDHMYVPFEARSPVVMLVLVPGALSHSLTCAVTVAV